MILPLLAAAIALSAFLVSLCIARLLCRKSATVERRADAIAGDKVKVAPKTIRRATRTRSSFLESRLSRLDDELYAAGITLRAEELVGVWALCAIGLPLALFLFGIPSVYCLIVCLIGAVTPVIVVRMARKKQADKLESQIVDALLVLTNSLRAGHSFQSATNRISQEMPDPISREFGRVFRETQQGVPLEESFNRLVERTGNEDLSLICDAVLIQRKIGGNLAQVLDNISDTIRQRIAMRGEIKSKTASGRTSGIIIGLLPPLILVILAIISPDYVSMFFTTTLGNVLLGACVILEFIGFLVIRKIISIKF